MHFVSEPNSFLNSTLSAVSELRFPGAQVPMLRLPALSGSGRTSTPPPPPRHFQHPFSPWLNERGQPIWYSRDEFIRHFVGLEGQCELSPLDACQLWDEVWAWLEVNNNGRVWKKPQFSQGYQGLWMKVRVYPW